MQQPLPALIGHRGLPLLAPENTRSSVRSAAEHGIAWIEVDVTMAGDGTLVMMHDLTLTRFGQSTAALADLTRSDLQAVDAGRWFDPTFAGEPLLMFEDFLALARDTGLGINLEIKTNPALDTSELVTSVLACLTASKLRSDKLLVSSFDLEALRLVRQQDPQRQLGALFESLPDDVQAHVEGIQPTTLHCDQSKLTESQARSVTRDWPLYCYTVNDPDTFAKLLGWGVSGVFCDRAHADDMRETASRYGLAIR